MLKGIKKKIKEDKGDAVIVLGLMLIMSLMLVGGILLDISKAYQLKSSYIDSARKATQAGIMEQTTEGYLRPEAAGRAIHVYEHIARSSVVNPDGYFSKCANDEDNKVKFVITFMNESGGELSTKAIERSAIPEVPEDAVKGIQPEIIASITSMTGLSHNDISSGKYTSIKLEVTEGTENAILPGAFSITQAGDERASGMRCQKLNISAKANIFTGDEDGLYD